MITIDLNKLPPPQIIPAINYETELQALHDILLNIDPSYSAALNNQSDPLALAMQTYAYRAMIKQQEFNDNARSLLLALSSGAALDHIGTTYYYTQRLEISPANNNTIPPTLAVMESDAAYLARLIIAPDRFSTAGSKASYIYWAKSAAGDVKDITATSPAPAQATITVLSHTANGTADAPLIAAVVASLNNDVRPLADEVTVQSAAVIEYTINADIKTYPGFSPDDVVAASSAAAQTFVNDNHRLDRDITLTRLYAALSVSGVMDITLNNTQASDITTNLVADSATAYYCTGITITHGGVDE